MQKTLAPDRECISFIEGSFADSLAASVSSLLGESVEVTPSAGRLPDGALVWYRFEFRPPSYGHISFGAPKEMWLDVGRKILSGAGEDNPDAETVLSTLTEIAGQVAGSILSAVSHQYQKSIEVRDLRVEERAVEFDGGSHTSFYRLAFLDGSSVPVSLCLPEFFVQELLPKMKAGEVTEITVPSVDNKKLERLLDVEMPVSVSIGRAQMALRDVIRLTTGSIVELSKNVSEPVDIVVNNCVVAKGDVVVIDGNFGIRIREVLSKEDRMRRFGHN